MMIREIIPGRKQRDGSTVSSINCDRSSHDIAIFVLKRGVKLQLTN